MWTPMAAAEFCRNDPAREARGKRSERREIARRIVVTVKKCAVLSLAVKVMKGGKRGGKRGGMDRMMRRTPMVTESISRAAESTCGYPVCFRQGRCHNNDGSITETERCARGLKCALNVRHSKRLQRQTGTWSAGRKLNSGLIIEFQTG
jgi:hypothetical protein